MTDLEIHKITFCSIIYTYHSEIKFLLPVRQSTRHKFSVRRVRSVALRPDASLYTVALTSYKMETEMLYSIPE